MALALRPVSRRNRDTLSTAPNHRMSWLHPRKGEQIEILCRHHDGEVLKALKTLNIGSSSELADHGEGCTRCALAGKRFWARDAAPVPSPEAKHEEVQGSTGYLGLDEEASEDWFGDALGRTRRKEK